MDKATQPYPAYLKSLFKEAKKKTNLDSLFEESAEEVGSEMESIEKIFKSNDDGLGFPVSDAPTSYQPVELSARHREILRLAALGYKHTTIAAMLGVTPVTVGYTIRSPLGQEYLASIEEARTDSVKDVHNRLKEISPLASEVLLDILVTGKEANRLRAAQEVLKMTGHSAEQKHLHLHTQITQEEIEHIKKTAKGGPKTLSEADLDAGKEVIVSE